MIPKCFLDLIRKKTQNIQPRSKVTKTYSRRQQKMFKIKTKNGVWALINQALGVSLFGIVLSVSAYMVSKIQTVGGFTAGTAANNVTVDTLSGLQTSSSFIPIIAIASVLGVVVATLLGAFGGFGRRGGLA